MKTLRVTTATLALALGLTLLVPSPSHAQARIAKVGTGHLVLAAANTYQFVRVTVGYPALIGTAPDDAPALPPPTGTVTFRVDGNNVSHTIEAGDFFTYTIDPKVDGRLIDARTGLRHVPVHFEFETDVVEGVPSPMPSITIELVNVRTGEAQTVHVAAGYTGTVKFTDGDGN